MISRHGEPLLDVTIAKQHYSPMQIGGHLLPIFHVKEACQTKGAFHHCCSCEEPEFWCRGIIVVPLAFQKVGGSPQRFFFSFFLFF